MIDIERLLVKRNFTLRDALKFLDENHQGALLLVDDNGKLIRLITDGDIRRLLLKEFTLEDTLGVLPTNSPKSLPHTASIQEAYHLMQKHEVDHIPLVDNEGKPTRLIHRRELSSTILLSSPHMGEYEQGYIQEAFNSNWVAPLGPNVDAFEKEIADYLGIKSSVALSSGTAALHLALVLLGVEREDIVFCSTFTFIASANVILYQGAVPVFIDSEFDTWNMSPKALKRALEDAKLNNKLPKAIIIVNLYGQSANFEELCRICEEYNVPIVEDAAESLGATYQGKHSGTFGKLSVFSFNGNKIITTSGGGMLMSDDSELIEKARFLATQARDPASHYEHSVVGYNYRMSNILAGVGRGQLRVLEKRVQARQTIFQHYKNALEKHPAIMMMPEPDCGRSTHWLSTLLINPKLSGLSPLEIINYLNKFKIEARRTWKPMHRQPLFEGTKYFSHEPDFSVSDYLFAQGMCLPSGSNLSITDIDRVIQCFLSCLEMENCLLEA